MKLIAFRVAKRRTQVTTLQVQTQIILQLIYLNGLQIILDYRLLMSTL